ncbi:pyruvate:ferredoxin (flavodoxin) oxidoreductase [Streptococcus massiliensis]|uniref:Pyruvate-flavodoxin oxidoreductase n=1 Tax=Streptococcus massiliensis TaxID=313439 RepID=A0A380KZ00_9STRE|nr:pyruvate:ferredoxin (flavodoxin) oxidoreductase [Streptococcus massiliensis]SUN77234.1 pyruvate-flavodoxin oxidoreductase [Streptococcus massiliensis]
MQVVLDGNEAVAHVSYAFTEVAAIYPITPSSTMAEKVEEMANRRKTKNAFGNVVQTIEMQSEAGVAGALHGLLKVGTLATTYTCSQGLLLMEPTLLKMAGEQLPIVLHVSARSLSTSALSIFGDHSDVMAVRHLGVIMICASSVQEAALFAAVAHELAVRARLPVLHFFDGFNTSHEQRKIVLPTINEIGEVIDRGYIHAFKKESMRNDEPTASGSSMAPDIYFQQLESNNSLYSLVPELMKQVLSKYNPLFGTQRGIVDYYGAKEAETVIIALGSVNDAIHQVVDELNQKDSHYGSLNLHLYRPFPRENFLEKLPRTVKQIVVLDRTKENGSLAEPLLLDIQSVCYELQCHPKIIGGRYGLGSKDVTAAQIRAAILEVEKEKSKHRFTIGIQDDVTNLSLEEIGCKDLTPVKNCFQSKTWGMGSDGAVSCSRQTAKTIGELSSLDVQGQFWFDSRKTDNLTVSHLRFSKEPIRSSYQVYHPNFVSCYTERYLKRYGILDGIQEGGTFLLNSSYGADKVARILPNKIRRILSQKRIRFYVIPASKLAREYELGPKVNTIMQVCFLKLTNLVDFKHAFFHLKDQVISKYSEISQELVDANVQVMNRALDYLEEVEIDPAWSSLPDEDEKEEKKLFTHMFDLQKLADLQKGNEIPVSAFVINGLSAGKFPTASSQNEKRFVCDRIPDWNSERCIQCNLCATVCPHAAIRPFLLDEEEQKYDFSTLSAKGKSNLRYRLQVSPKDCTGCGLCYDICPARGKALNMVDADIACDKEAKHWDYVTEHHRLAEKKSVVKTNVRESQFQKPLLEFPSACAGCGEPAYIKMITQLFGSSMMIANATGCSSIWGCSNFSVPYAKNENGYGPAWGTSLLENNAEYGYGMQIGSEVLQANLADKLRQYLLDSRYSQEFKKSLTDWLVAYEYNQHYEAVSQLVINAVINEKEAYPELNELYDLRFLLAKRSQWIVGGDGWAYDIGYGGLDHILSTDTDVNVLILDTEGYSNTGGQTSKASPLGSRNKFSSSGNRRRKKDLANILIQNENIYVAQIAIGASPEQTLKAIIEAERYKGPAVLIAYSPCILHGLIQNSSVIEEKKAVECGYWPLFRYHPATSNQESSFTIDHKAPKWETYSTFLHGEERFSSLGQISQKHQENLLKESYEEAKRRFRRYQDLEEHYQIRKKKKNKEEINHA